MMAQMPIGRAPSRRYRRPWLPRKLNLWGQPVPFQRRRVRLAPSPCDIDAFCLFDSVQLSRHQVRELHEGVGGFTALLAKSDVAHGQDVYRTAGSDLRNSTQSGGAKVTASAQGLFCVGRPI